MKKQIYTLALAVLAALTLSARDVTWHPVDELPLFGKGVDDACTSLRFQRVPDSIQATVRPGVFWLGRQSAGMALRFRSDSPFISVKWSNTDKVVMNHMTPTGIRGLDLYTLLPDGSWTFVNSARPDINNISSTADVISNMEPEMREYMLYLPLYDGVDSLYVGTAPEAAFALPAVDLPVREKPIVWYGTSLLQGGCANRAGMAHTNILSRRLNREIINLGFSGNGQLDLEIARVIAAVPDPGLIIMDCVPNINHQQMDTLLIPFYNIVREAHPTVPMLFVEDPIFPHSRFDKKMYEEVTTLNAHWKRMYEDLAAKDKNLHYLTSDNFGRPDHEQTVDGLHYTDLGFMRLADLMEPIIRRITLPIGEQKP